MRTHPSGEIRFIDAMPFLDRLGAGEIGVVSDP